MLKRAIADPERGYGKLDIRADEDALRVWATKSDGDARRALTALEVAVLSSEATERRSDGATKGNTGGSRAASDLDRGARDDLLLEDERRRERGEEEQPQAIVITRQVAEDSIQQKAAVYDATGDEHYDVISAMIKSVRGSDPDAAVFWIARMLDAGEDPRFIARRLAILASEDIGNADPRGIMVAAACWELVERIGMPEARIVLAQCATYLAMAPKSNASYVAINEAMEDVRGGRTVSVPTYLRDKNSSPLGVSGEERPQPGEGYEYSHDVPGAITGQDYLGVDKKYYRPGNAGVERQFAERLEQIRKLKKQ